MTAAPQPHRHRVLVVEDDEDLLEALLGLLKAAGYTVLGAANGYEALANLRGGSPPCVILLDLMLPLLDGWQFRRKQLEDPALAGVPVIGCSARDREGADVPALRVEYYTQKPLNLERLLASIADCCARETSPAAI